MKKTTLIYFSIALISLSSCTKDNTCTCEKKVTATGAALPTTIFQDNQTAIQISNNRGALSKRTRAMDMRTLSVRNKVEDMKVVPVYMETAKMLADIGTKALDPSRFESLRDMLTGYGVLEAMKQGNWGAVSSLMVLMAKQKLKGG